MTIPAISFGDASHHKHDSVMEDIMEANVDSLFIILHNILHDQKYDQVEIIANNVQKHAIQVKRLYKDHKNQQASDFMLYATELDVNTEHLAMIAKKISSKETPKTEQKYLQILASHYFGQIITSCVSCHTDFRGKH